MKEEIHRRTLVIGYGNPYCRDDGVGFYIVNGLRKRVGHPEIEADEDGLDGLGRVIDTVLLHQLVPEIASLLPAYQAVLFVDAHTGTIPEEVRLVPVVEEYGFHAVTHHLSPGMLLALARRQLGRVPEGYLLSVRGDDFDFGLGLSETCRRRADEAMERILSLLPGSSGVAAV
jgi:hydrogenase maturation protease